MACNSLERSLGSLSPKLGQSVGAKIRALDLDLTGWEVDLIGPANLVNVDALVPSETNPLTIPLLQAASGELELTLEAHRKLSATSEDVSLEMPRPQGDQALQT